VTEEQKLILINGASGGVGYQLVEFFLQKGHRNIACQYNTREDKIKDLLLAHDLAPEKHLYQADLTDEQSVQKMRESIESNLGKVEILLNMIGGSTNSMSWKLSIDDFKKIMDINVLATFLSCREFVPAMRENKFGRIINVSSVVGFTGVPGASHYCAAKAAIVGFSKSLSLELASKGITVNTLGLGYFNAGLIEHVSPELQDHIKSTIPFKRFGEVKEIGGLVTYLTSKEAEYITGQVHHINGGMY
jgi:3-oxoacyl-[acyl-carrier protein] reductase